MIMVHTHMCTHAHKNSLLLILASLCAYWSFSRARGRCCQDNKKKKAIESVSFICKRLFTGIYPASNVRNTNKTSGLTQIHISSVFFVILIGVICTHRETCLFICHWENFSNLPGVSVIRNECRLCLVTCWCWLWLPVSVTRSLILFCLDLFCLCDGTHSWGGEFL